MTLSCANLFWQSSGAARNSLLMFMKTCIPAFKVSIDLCVCWIPFLSDLGGKACLYSLLSERKSLTSSPFLISSFPLQFSTSRVFMGGTTTATLLTPAAEARPSCASAVGRFAVARWFESKTHTSTFSASPVKVKKPEKTHTYTQTNTFISFLSCDRFWFEWRKHTTTSRSGGVDLKSAAAALQCSPQDFSLPSHTDNRQPLPECAARQQFSSAQAHAGVQPCSQSSI